MYKSGQKFRHTFSRNVFFFIFTLFYFKKKFQKTLNNGGKRKEYIIKYGFFQKDFLLLFQF